MKKNRFRLVPACYLMLVKNDQLLMLRRFNTGYDDGKYGLVAGHLDGGETFRETMIREAYEEVGIKLKTEDLKVVHVMHRFAVPNPLNLRERVDIFLQAGTWEGEPKNMEPNKCNDIRWFSIDKIPENTMLFIKQLLENYKNNILYSEFGF